MNEARKVFKNNPYLSIVFVSLLSLTLIFSNILFGNTLYLNQRNKSVDNWAHAYFFTLTDSISFEEEQAFWNTPDCVQRMKDTVDQFENSQYNYCLMTHQATCATNLILPDEYYYYLPRSQSGEPLYSEGLLDTYQMNANTWRLFDLQLESGREFRAEDYEYHSTIPIVVGAEYRRYLDVGSKIECYYLEQILTMEVVGILCKDSLIVRQGAIEPLD